MPELGEIIGVLDDWYPASGAEKWDAVGLVCGELDRPIERILLAIDAVPATVAQAERIGAQLVMTHHPLLLTAVHGVPAADPKGGLVHRMIRSSIAHFVAHTNAEVAPGGVSHALADLFGLTGVEPLERIAADSLGKLVVFVPIGSSARLVDALAEAGAGRIGEYERCAWTTDGVGTFRPGPGASPTVGRAGEIEEVGETRVEMIVPAARRAEVDAALRAVHPYEEPAFDLLTLAPEPSDRGVGRVGNLTTQLSLAEFTAFVAGRLPATTWGVRAAGDPDRAVRRIAVLAGSGSSLVDTARRSGADVYLTADLKHHNGVEAVTQRPGTPMALVDAAHWATERPWLDVVAARLREFFGATVNTVVSDLVTDPWTLHEPSPPPNPESR